MLYFFLCIKSYILVLKSLIDFYEVSILVFIFLDLFLGREEILLGSRKLIVNIL